MVSLGILAPFGKRYVPTVGGVILFGKEEVRSQHVPDAKVDCARFLGTTKAKILDRLQIKASILDAIEEVSKFISRNTRLEAEIRSFKRKDIPEYPTVGIREALINAIAHADYSLLGSRIKIAIYSDRLEIENLGMFPFGYTMDDFIAGISKARNRVIVRTLNEIGFMEEWGSGYKRIHEFCKEQDYPNPKWEEFGAALRVTFYPFGTGHYISENSTLTTPQNLSERERLILSLFQIGDTLPFKDIYSRLTITISERMLRYNLVELAKKGVLISEGKGRNAAWKRIG